MPDIVTPSSSMHSKIESIDDKQHISFEAVLMESTPEVWATPNAPTSLLMCTVATQTVENMFKSNKSGESGRRGSNKRLRKPEMPADRESRTKELAKVVEASLKTKFGQTLSHAELLVIARFVSKKCGVQIDRDATRRKSALLAWCAENIDDFLPVLAKTTGKYCPSDFELESESSDTTS